MVNGAAEGAATPEVAAYLAQKEVSQASAQVTWRRVALFLAAVLAFVLGVLIYFAVTVGMIRATQVANTKVSHCQVQTFDAILKDARLAFMGDKTAADYAKAPKGC